MNETIQYRPGDDVVINQNHKLVTLRLPADRYIFRRGQELSAVCGNISIPTVVFDTKTEPLNKIHPVMLALDGFFDIKTAVAEMRKIGDRYKDVKENTPFTWVAFLTNEEMNAVSPQTRSVLVGDTMEVYLRNRELAVGLFGPAITYWATEVRHMSKPALKRFMEKNLPL